MGQGPPADCRLCEAEVCRMAAGGMFFQVLTRGIVKAEGIGDG
jgi:hypothetical protein